MSDQDWIKQINRRQIIQIFRSLRNVTKQQIAQTTGVSIPTVTHNVNQLLEEGLVTEAGIADSTGGRKPVILSFNPDARFSIGLDVSQKGISCILVNLDIKLVAQEYYAHEDISSRNDLEKNISLAIDKITEKSGIDPDLLIGTGISLPGVLNRDKSHLIAAANLGLINVSLEGFVLESRYKLFFENEANAAAYAELCFSPARRRDSLSFLSISSGVGMGLVMDGAIYYGANGKSGEIGHMTMVPGGRKCNCGSFGCLEQYVSEQALLGFYQDENAPKNISDFFGVLEKGDEKAQEALKSYLQYLSYGIYNVLCFIDPRYIVLGGALGHRLGPYIDDIREKVFTNESYYQRKDVEIMVSTLKDQSSLFGAALLPINTLLDPHIEGKLTDGLHYQPAM